MSDDAKPRRRRKGKYVPRSNAVHITLYDPSGAPLTEEIVEQAQAAMDLVALTRQLATNTART